MPLQKSQFIDKVPWWVASLVALAYLIAFIICCSVGGAGPQNATVSGSVSPFGSSSLTCANPQACSVTWVGGFSGLSGYNQALWMTASMRRPFDSSFNQSAPRYALPNAQVVVPILYNAIISASSGAGWTQLANVTSSGSMTCMPGAAFCSPMLIFTQSFITYSTYVVSFQFINPYEGFYDGGISHTAIAPNTTVVFDMEAGWVNSDFTHFELSGKYTFFTLTFIVWVGYLLVLHQFGKGIRNPRTGELLPATSEQNWAAVLGAFCVWYNDPAFAASVTAPTFAASGFYAVCAVTFLVTLLLYWLVHFDDARRLGEVHSIDGGRGASDVVIRKYGCSRAAAGLIFWIPKLVWSVVTWVLVLAYYMVQRTAWLSDPTANVISNIPFVNQFFVQFIAAWGAFYVIYLFLLLLANFYQCRVISPSSRSVLAVTVLTISVTLAAFFSESFVTVNAATGSTIFMASLGGVNIYVWYLMVVVSPLYPHTEEDLLKAERADVAAAAYEEQLRAGELGAAKLKAGPGVEATTQTDDPEWLQSAMMARGGVGGSSAVETGAVSISLGGPLGASRLEHHVDVPVHDDAADGAAWK